MDVLQQHRQVEKMGFLTDDLWQQVVEARVTVEDCRQELQVRFCNSFYWLEPVLLLQYTDFTGQMIKFLTHDLWPEVIEARVTVEDCRQELQVRFFHSSGQKL